MRVPTMVYLSRGSLAIMGDDEVQLAVVGSDPRSPKVETLKAEATPEQYQSGPAYLAHCLLYEEPFEGLVDPEVSRNAQEVLEAGLISMGRGW